MKSLLICVGVTCALVVVSSTLAARKTSPYGLENRRWRIAGYRGEVTNNSDEQRLIDAPETAEITFAKGRIHGSPTCGALGGTYRLSVAQLTVQADVVIAGFCPQGTIGSKSTNLERFQRRFARRGKRRAYRSARQERAGTGVACALLSSLSAKNAVDRAKAVSW